MRLAKFLADAGVASRRACEGIVRAARVTVDGHLITDPAHAVGARSIVMVDGARVAEREPQRVVYAVNKPAGVISTAADPQGRTTVVSLISTGLRLYPVGRLDADSTGLILLTNDGALAYKLTHPSFEVAKTYRAVVRNPPVRRAALLALRAGVRLEDGLTAPAHVTRLAPDTLEITIHEGRKRQVKRMCEYVGHRVISLQRTAFGPLELGGLALGAHRRLSAREVELLRRAGRSSGRPRRAGPRRDAANDA